MRIAVICGHFIPEVGYHEVSLAKALASLGHEVYVITSNQIPASVKKQNNFRNDIIRIIQDQYSYSIVRLKSIINYRSIVIPIGLKKKVKEINPSLIILFGIAKMFQTPLLLSNKSLETIIITFFGDNEDMKRSRSSKYLKNLYRRVLYRRAISKSDKVALYTPSTEEIISNITGSFWYKNYRNKQINSSLGFDNNDYYFDPQLRYSKRSSLGIKNDEIVLIYSSRVVRNKGLEIILKAVDECITEGHKLKMIIIGLFDDLYGFKIRKDISIIKNQGNFILFGFLNQKEINEYFNCADAGIWGQASISIQQAMGTGLFVLLPQRKSVSHLITENLNGAYYKDILTLKKRIKLLTDNDKRDEIVLFNQKFNNLILCQDILTRTFNDLAT